MTLPERLARAIFWLAIAGIIGGCILSAAGKLGRSVQFELREIRRAILST